MLRDKDGLSPQSMHRMYAKQAKAGWGQYTVIAGVRQHSSHNDARRTLCQLGLATSWCAQHGVATRAFHDCLRVAEHGSTVGVGAGHREQAAASIKATYK